MPSIAKEKRRACFHMYTRAKSDNELVIYLHAHLLALPCHQKFPCPPHHPSKLAIANRGKPIQYSKLDISQSKRSDFSIHPSASPSPTRKERDSSIVSVENLMPWQTSPVSNEVEKNSTLRRSNATHTHARPVTPQKIATKPDMEPFVRNTKSASLCRCRETDRVAACEARAREKQQKQKTKKGTQEARSK
jgi:hypothetical protein